MIQMRIYLLGGNDVSNKWWIEEIQTKLMLSSHFSQVDFCDYEHRQHEHGNINFEVESGKLLAWVAASDEEYLIFCKSAGAVLFLSTVDKLQTLPQKVIMCGFPIWYAKARWFTLAHLLKTYSFPIVLLQNENDHAGTFEEVSQLLQWVSGWELAKLPGDTHSYGADIVIDYVLSDM